MYSCKPLGRLLTTMVCKKKRGKLLCFLVSALQISAACCCYKRLVYHGQFPLLYIDDCTSNYDLGLLVGSTFSSMIKGRLRGSIAFQKVQAYVATNWGRQLLAALKDMHHYDYPEYYAELQGLAAGSGVPFDQIFMLNLRQEILTASESPEKAVRQWLEAFVARREGKAKVTSTTTTAATTEATEIAGAGSSGSSHRGDADDNTNPSAELGRPGRDGANPFLTSRTWRAGGGLRSRIQSNSDRGARGARMDQRDEAVGQGGAGGDAGDPGVDPSSGDACSDVAVRLRVGRDPGAPPRILLGHNEDATADTLGRMYYIRATMPGRGTWFALTYAGELASTAFGANTAGVAFTLNALYPTEALLPGLGRNFLSRRLLDATTTEEALDLLSTLDQAVGRSVNLVSTRNPMGVWNVEVGPGGTYDVQQLADDSWYFHANSYLRLPQKQKVDNSSIHRQDRAVQFPMPTTAVEVLAVLGDTADPDFPIFRTGDYGGLMYTLCTSLYDLTARTITVFRGNPRDGVVGSVLSLDTLMPR